MLKVGNQKAYDVQETAGLLNITVATVRDYIKKGKLSARKVGTRYYIAEETLKSFLRG